MLQLITGIAGSGKTKLVQKKIVERALTGKHSMLIVPEQYSWQAENDTFRLLKDEKSAFAEVYSFSKFARVVNSVQGGTALKQLSDAAKNVLIKQAVEDLEGELKTFRRHKKDVAFYEMCSDAIKELKLAGIQPDKLYYLAEKEGDKQNKLKEVALIYSEYEAKITQGYIDEETLISNTSEKLSEDMFAGTEIFIDGFEGFTAPELMVLKKILSLNVACTITLTCDNPFDYTDEFGLFAHTKKTVHTLLKIAKDLNVDVKDIIILPQSKRFIKKELQELELFLRGGLNSSDEQFEATSVYITNYSSVHEEVNNVLAQIRNLATANSARYGEMAIICRDMNSYKTVIKQMADSYKVPIFIDDASTIEHTAPVVLIRAILSIAAKGINTPDVLRILKTGLIQFNNEEIEALENYAFTWQILYEKAWKTTFKLNPNGFSEYMGKGEQIELELAEKARKQVVEWLLPFIGKIKKTNGKQMAKEIYNLMVNMQVDKAVARKAKELQKQGSTILTEQLIRTWDAGMQMLDEVAELTEEIIVSPREFDDILLLLVRSSDVGASPQNADMAVFARADRMRLSNPKYTFVIGMGEGQFPAFSESMGLLTYADRKWLEEEVGIDMQGAYLNRARIENLFFYKALTSASHGIFISCSENEGELQTLTARIDEFKERANVPSFYATLPNKASTPVAALTEYALNYAKKEVISVNLQEALQKEVPIAFEKAQNYAEEVFFNINNTSTLKNIIGNKLSISPSQAKRYFECPFSYYLRYVIKAKPRRIAEFSPIESGNFIHFILENVMDAGRDFFLNMKVEAIEKTVSDLADLYVKQNIQGEVIETRRFKSLLNKLKKEAVELLWFVQAEQKQSDFYAVAYEVEIGEGKDIEPISLYAETGEQVLVTGKIDRLDIMQKNDKKYVRVIDYKTGIQEFSLDEVFYGLNTQMLIYLFSVCKNGKGEYEDSIPAGVLYLIGDAPPKTKERDDRDSEVKAYKTDGLLLEDDEVLHGMDKSGQGLFIPAKYKNGKLTTNRYVASLAKMGNIEQHIQNILTDMASNLYKGQIDAVPAKNTTDDVANPCKYCEYSAVCRHKAGTKERIMEKQENPFAEEVTA